MVNNKDSACQVNPVLSRKADREVGQVGRVIPNAPQLEDFYREGTRRSAKEREREVAPGFLRLLL